MDQYGYCTWFFEDGFMTSNNVDYVTYDETGMPRFALDEKFVRAKQAAEDTVNKYKIAPAVWWDPNPQERFWNGEIAMDYWGYWEMPGMHENMGDKLGMAPFPRGPDLPADLKNRDVAETIGLGVTGTAKDPDLACLYLEWMYEANPEAKAVSDATKLEQYGSQEMLDLAKEWAGNSIQTDYSGFGQGFVDAMNLVLQKPADKSWQQALDENRAAIQKALDDSIVNMK
jgi:multiple sugar transport system substrate-binding protein